MSQATKQQSAFLSFPIPTGFLFSFEEDQHPSKVGGWNQSSLRLDNSGTHFGFVQSGSATLSTSHGRFEASPGMYFAIPGQAEIHGSGDGLVVTRLGYRGFFHLGGPIEQTGRLRYIDGCTDSLLISPVVWGDPCLNLLSIPPQTDQTAHTHPSIRVGMIVRGEGMCRVADGDVPLVPGQMFIIRPNGLHSFHTRDSSLLIIAWHPDSDFGPTHETHPMLNRTLVSGRPVNANGEH